MSLIVITQASDKKLGYPGARDIVFQACEIFLQNEIEMAVE